MSGNLGFKIRSLRLELGLTLDEFGKLIGNANKSNVFKWEKGMSRPNNKRIQKMAELAGVSIEEFLNNEHKIKSINEANELFKELQMLELSVSNLSKMVGALSDTNSFELLGEIDSNVGDVSFNEYKIMHEEALVREQKRYDSLLKNLVRMQNEFLNSKLIDEFITQKSLSLNSLLESESYLTLNEKILTAEDKKRALEILKLVFK